jgi:hypothetical protein
VDNGVIQRILIVKVCWALLVFADGQCMKCNQAAEIIWSTTRHLFYEQQHKFDGKYEQGSWRQAQRSNFTRVLAEVGLADNFRPSMIRVNHHAR